MSGPLGEVYRPMTPNLRRYWLDLWNAHGAGGRCPIHDARCGDGALAKAVLTEAGHDFERVEQ